ncbi:MAG: tetratricopeptide repeat protein [Myxococcota bacterium]
MSRRLRLALLACLLGGGPGLGEARVHAAPPREALRDAEQALRELRLESADTLVEELRRADPGDAEVLSLSGRLALHRGRYARAAEWLAQSLRVRPPRPGLPDARPELLALAASTATQTRTFVEASSGEGRYRVRHAPGVDAVLVPYALATLEAADRAMTEVLGVRVPGPIRLELYGSARELAAVSFLSAEAIERTGTIALCKWDRLMVTSPRALLRGYPWRDTIAHELVHLVLSRATRDRAPVWMQEGMARFLERRWREDEPRLVLQPAVAALLASRRRAGTLLGFDQLHPSIALLPSQEDAALAFAQVATFMEAFHAAQGTSGFRAAVARVAGGEEATEAFAAASGQSFAALERGWRRALEARAAPGSAPELAPLRFRRGEEDGEELDRAELSAATALPDAVRRAVRLGDLLWARRRPGAAAVKYGEAHARVPGDPLVASRFARAALAGGRPAEARAALVPLAARRPEHAPTFSLLGRAWQLEGNATEARRAATVALGLNPFDPRPHCVLAEVLAEAGERSEEARWCARLGGMGP